MRTALLLILFAVVGCEGRDEPDPSPYATREPFVAEDAGRIPLTTPGTEHRVERATIGFPEISDAVPEPVPEEPHELQVEPPVPAAPPVTRQQRAIDTIRFDSVQTTRPPLVRPATPPAPAPPPGAAPPAPRPAPATPPPVSPTPTP